MNSSMVKKIFLIFFLIINCHTANRQVKLPPIIYFPDLVKAKISIDLDEIQINRNWKQGSYLKFSSLNSYQILVKNEEFKIFLRDKLQEKLAESNLTKEDFVSVEIYEFSINYTVEKDFGITFPSETITSVLDIKAVAFIKDKRHEISYSQIITPYQRQSGFPLLFTVALSQLFDLFGAFPERGYSLLVSIPITAVVFYYSSKTENIEKYFEMDLNKYCSYLRDKLEILADRKNK
jgi:hypothetical protein